MKRTKILLASFGFVLATISGTGLASAAQIAPISLHCPTSDGEFTNNNTESCDLAVDKQVSTNGIDFVDANTSTAAPSVYVGNTVTWKITVSNLSVGDDEDLTPTGTVYLQDVLPAGFTETGHSASDGTYVTDQSSFFANMWYFPAPSGQVTLTITTKAMTTGDFKNTATLAKYDTGSCDGGCTYVDADSENNSDDAWVKVQAVARVLGASTTVSNSTTGTSGDPQVLGASTTLADTGVNTTLVSLLAGGIICSSIGVFAYAPARNKYLRR